MADKPDIPSPKKENLSSSFFSIITLLLQSKTEAIPFYVCKTFLQMVIIGFDFIDACETFK